MESGSPGIANSDVLSPLARQLLRKNADSACTRLVTEGSGNEQARQLLAQATPDALLSRPVSSTDDAQAMLAALWLWHDWLDESHRISQQIHTATGSFWHAIMHRREGDFSNSKYWYARCTGHPSLQALAPQAATILNPYGADKSLLRLVAGGWNPSAFVDLVEQLHTNPQDPRHPAAIALQQAEWRLLFDHCTRAATGI